MKVLFCPATDFQVEPLSVLTKTLSVPMFATPTKILLDPLDVFEFLSKVTHEIPIMSDE